MADPRTLTFSPGMSRVCFDVTILDDDQYEPSEDFFVNLTSSARQTTILPMSTIIAITDNERKSIVSAGWSYSKMMCILKLKQKLINN